MYESWSLKSFFPPKPLRVYVSIDTYLEFIVCIVCLVTRLCPTLCDPMDGSEPCSSVCGASQARILEWVAIPFSRGPSRPGDGAPSAVLLSSWANGEELIRAMLPLSLAVFHFLSHGILSCKMTVNLHLPGERLQCDPRAGREEGEEKQEKRESRQQKLLSWMLPLWCQALDLVSPPGMHLLKDFNDPDNHGGVITHLEPDILAGEVKWTLGSITMNKVRGGDGIQAELLQNPERWCCESATLNNPANLENSAVATGLEKVSFHSSPKEGHCQRMFRLLHNCTHLTCQQSDAQNSPR